VWGQPLWGGRLPSTPARPVSHGPPARRGGRRAGTTRGYLSPGPVPPDVGGSVCSYPIRHSLRRRRPSFGPFEAPAGPPPTRPRGQGRLGGPTLSLVHGGGGRTRAPPPPPAGLPPGFRLTHGGGGRAPVLAFRIFPPIPSGVRWRTGGRAVEVPPRGAGRGFGPRGRWVCGMAAGSVRPPGGDPLGRGVAVGVRGVPPPGMLFVGGPSPRFTLSCLVGGGGA